MTAAWSDRYQLRYRIGFWSLLSLLTLVRLALSGDMGLSVDESHYAMYARYLDWGYVDHPPMVAWLAALGSPSADTPFYLRLLPILLNSLSVVLLRRLALLLWADERIAFWALVILTLLPYQHLLMVALLPDAGLNVFWCATLLSFRKAIRTGRMKAWGLTGVWLGGALLSKYYAILLPICLGGYLLTASSHRKWLRRPYPYIALLIAVVIYSPNLIWNAKNGWISYLFHLGRSGSAGLEIGDGLAAIGGQLAVWSPVLFGLLIAALVVIARRKPADDKEIFVLWGSLPVFAFFIAIGFLGKVLPHWTSPGWWCGSLALVSVGISKAGRAGRAAIWWRRASIAGAIIAFLMTAVLYISLYLPVVEPAYNYFQSASLKINRILPAIKPLPPYQTKFDPTNDLFGWPEAAREVHSVLRRMPRPHQTFVFTHRFFEASQLAVYLPDNIPVTTLGRRIDQYRIWFRPKDHLGWDALFLDFDRRSQGPDRYLPLFEQVRPTPQIVDIDRNGRQIRKIKLYRYSNYKGGVSTLIRLLSGNCLAGLARKKKQRTADTYHRTAYNIRYIMKPSNNSTNGYQGCIYQREMTELPQLGLPEQHEKQERTDKNISGMSGRKRIVSIVK